MAEYISFPKVALKRGKPVPSIEVDSDAIEGQYASGAWEDLVASFTADWVKRKGFSKIATIWTWGTESVSFHHPGYSVFLAQFGLPMAYFEALQRHLAKALGETVRFSDYVQPEPEDGWKSRIHVQDGAAWIPEDVDTWSKVTAKPPAV